MPLYLREADVAELLTTADALAAVEDSFRRLARGAVDNRPRERLRLAGGVADRVDPRGAPLDRARRRLLPQRAASGGVLSRARLRTGGVASRGGRTRGRRHGDDVEGSRAARRLAAAGNARVCRR